MEDLYRKIISEKRDCSESLRFVFSKLWIVVRVKDLAKIGAFSGKQLRCLPV